MHVALGGNAGTDVQKLGDARPDHVAHCTAQECPVGLHDQRQFRPQLDRPTGHPTVDREVVRATEVVVIHSGHAGRLEIHANRRPARLFHRLPPGVMPTTVECDTATQICPISSITDFKHVMQDRSQQSSINTDPR